MGPRLLAWDRFTLQRHIVSKPAYVTFVQESRFPTSYAKKNRIKIRPSGIEIW